MINKLQLILCFLVVLYLMSSLVCDIKTYQKIQSARVIELKREVETKCVVCSRLGTLLRLMETETIYIKNKERLTNLKHNLQL